MNSHSSVEDYINSFPPTIQKSLLKIRQIILGAAPEATESISYAMPSYKLHKRPLAYFAAYNNHIGFYPIPSGILKFKKELSIYKQGKGSVQFPNDQPIPYDLVEKIVKLRVQEINKAIKKRA